ncbi:UDP-N-acetylmuramoyl-L-alanine--D-glutamate ligase [Desulfovibrio sp. PG-178-WT-4]|uniref:UDP-N-acetylmuramoylalanine--D-glutamate ligase n=1 Tax=Desulfovibrio porci TaxID=2605782 RepID=A0A6L5XHI8_9BACT|nr:UDP-N-acetylmuramoyl-L-alanine--D-glutamate ligase [Desulfovibrio porci]MDY3808689.1 UDP-N-acetylmuramoyl-L-alanine--D-glutamate ligase [Desulfovibrio porci]MSS26559.1 UDP-N-acetylmuramoyl-L-alanine--D-glutamate ligase [Desulfovibrio porci]
MALEKTRGRRIQIGELAVVVGAGRSGLAAARLLSREGARVRLLDRNTAALSPEQAASLQKLGVDVQLGEHSPEQFEHAAFVVPSPGMPVAKLAQYLGGACEGAPEVLAEMELAWRYLNDEPVLAVTGTSGKTTTASLAAAMLQAQGYTVFLGGNIGTPLSEYVLSGRKADVLVLEISSFQLQACSTFCPRAGVLLNITPNHLDYHKDMAEYTEAKFRLFRCQDEGDLAVLGADLQELARGFNLRARQVWVRESERFPQSGLLGAHNKFNEEAAWQACRFFGVSEANAARAVARFKPLPHRLELVRERGGVLYVNDSKCTTVSSLKVALQAFDRPLRLLCGGKFKGGDLAALGGLVRERVREVALFGASREHFEKAWRDLAPLRWHPTLEEAVRALAASAKEGDVVLLAPATSSFDLYDNYMARGDDFKRIVSELA